MVYGTIGGTAVLIAVAIAVCAFGYCRAPAPTISDAAYDSGNAGAPCATARGEPGAHVIEDQGLTIAVRAPANYIATQRHPLIIVYAPAGFGPTGSERFADDFTTRATRDGFVVAYVGHVAMTTANLETLGGARKLVADRWCIDPQRVFDLGHSDGGSVAAGLRLTAPASFSAAASVVSAAGIRGEDLTTYDCPDPRPLMIIHARNDELFPGFGQETAPWWAACHQCRPELSPSRADGCRAFSECPIGAETLLCETDGTHTDWPDLNASILSFFKNFRRPNDKTD